MGIGFLGVVRLFPISSGTAWECNDARPSKVWNEGACEGHALVTKTLKDFYLHTPSFIALEEEANDASSIQNKNDFITGWLPQFCYAYSYYVKHLRSTFCKYIQEVRLRS